MIIDAEDTYVESENHPRAIDWLNTFYPPPPTSSTIDFDLSILDESKPEVVRFPSEIVVKRSRIVSGGMSLKAPTFFFVSEAVNFFGFSNPRLINHAKFLAQILSRFRHPNAQKSLLIPSLFILYTE